MSRVGSGQDILKFDASDRVTLARSDPKPYHMIRPVKALLITSRGRLLVTRFTAVLIRRFEAGDK